MTTPTKPYTITDASDPRQSEDIDQMFEEVYQALFDLDTHGTAIETSTEGVIIAQVATRVLLGI